MTFREKLADWLTGGTYSDACAFADQYFDLRQEMDDNARSCELAKVWTQSEMMMEALESISSIPVTPSSNGQTRKAVRIAKEALK